MPRGKAKAAAAKVPFQPLSKNHKLLVEIIVNQTGLEEQDVTLDSTLDDLQMDSLDFIECIMELEERLGAEIDEEPISHLKNVREVLAALDKATAKPGELPAEPKDDNKT